jgi:hypothetical protein
LTSGHGINWERHFPQESTKYVPSDDSLKNLDSIGGDGGIESADVEAEDLVFKSEDPTPEEQDTEIG